MKFGVVFPQIEMPSDPVAIRDYAQAVEGMGFDHLMAYDHVLGANPDRPGGWNGPYTYQHPFQEPFMTFAYLAAVTQHIEFTTDIIILPQRQTALVAKQAAQVDVLSGGRLRLGVGIGWNDVEYAGLNENFQNRGKRIEEQIEVLRLLWKQPLVTFEGKWHHIPDAGINPRPAKGSIPIWLGGDADSVLERTARLGDGWLMFSYQPLAEMRPAVEKICGYLDQYGRSLGNDFGMEVHLHGKNSLPEEWPGLIEAWGQMGGTHLCLNTMGMHLRTPDEHLVVVKQFAEVAGITAR